MRIILEGADNSGKTTLAQLLVRETDMMYHHPGGRPKDASAELTCLLDQMSLVVRHKSLLMDRCTAISQQVYTPDIKMEAARNVWLDEVAHTHGAILVYCRPSTDWLMSFQNFTWREGETEEFKQEIIGKQHLFVDRYDELFRRIPHVHFDHMSEEASTVVRYLTLASKGSEMSEKVLRGIMNTEIPCK